ncbi:dihydrodipicolinate synthase family protein [Stetteria hydrogenophila]
MLAAGVITPLATPLTADGKIDLKAFSWLVSKLAESGVDGFFVGSSVGEYTRLEPRELLALTGVALEYSGGKPVFAGATSDSTLGSVKLGLALRDLGVDGLVVAPPCFLRPPQDKLVAHFTEIASRTELPVIIYNAQSLTGYEVSPEVVARAAFESSNIVGLKASTYDLSYPRRVLYSVKSMGVKEFSLLAGHDDLLLPYLALGAFGGVPGLSNAVPEVHVGLYRSWVEGDYSKALNYHRALVEAARLYDIAGSPACAVKALLEARGAPVKAICRMPGERRPNGIIAAARALLVDMGVEPWTRGS